MPTIGEGILEAGRGIAGGIEKRSERKIEDQKTLRNLELYKSITGRTQVTPGSKLAQVLDPANLIIEQGLADGTIKDLATAISLQEKVFDFANRPLEQATKKAGLEKTLQDIEEGKFEKEQRDIAKEDPAKTLEVQTELAKKREGLKLQKEKEVQTAAEKRAQEQKENVLRGNLKIVQTQRTFNRMVAEQQKINPDFEPGRFGGVELIISGFFGKNPEVKAFLGDLNETATALGKIAAPSAKIGPDFVRQFKETLTSIFSTQHESVKQLSQSVASAFANLASVNPADVLTKEELEFLSPLEQTIRIDEITDKYRVEFEKFLTSLATGETPKLSPEAAALRARELAEKFPDKTQDEIARLVGY